VRTIGVVTVARCDYGIYLPLLREIQASADLKLHLMVSGMHLSPEFGLTVETIGADGFAVDERVEMLLSSDTPVGIAKSMGIGAIGFAQAFARCRPDILVVLGDRFDMFAAALAALPFRIPVAHIHGGELTQGAIDDALRHSITKLSHLHFVATHDYARRVIQLGEEPWRVTVSGALGLDNLNSIRLLTIQDLEVKYGLRLQEPFLLVTFHPATLKPEQTEGQMRKLLTALEEAGISVIFTMPNADTGGRIIRRMIRDFTQTHPTAQYVESLGTQGYFSLMALAAAMVGNSSSGLIEAPSFKLPVVNIGTRQDGRARAANVIDVGYTRTEIVVGIKRAIAPAFREKLQNLVNPYGSGHASEKIIEQLKGVSLDDRLITKRFYDIKFSLPSKGTFRA
jgi:UDP-hydrolysing UDP-N-acetyl-D-glucosamine 2-epimerase